MFYVTGVVVLILIGSSMAQEFVRQVSIQREIRRLELDIQQQEERNAELAQLLESLNSSTSLEKEARTKLGLQKEGETVIALQPPQQSTPTQEIQDQSQVDLRTNPEKWANSFLHP